MMGTLPKDFILDGKYRVLLFIKQGRNAESYRVKGGDGKLYFLKVFNPAALHRTAFDSDGRLLEIEFLKQLRHPNLVAYVDSGEGVVANRRFLYLVQAFIVGETLQSRLAREPVSTAYEARQVVAGVLNGLQYLHSRLDPIVHNGVSPENVILDLSGPVPIAKLIDFGNARLLSQKSDAVDRSALNAEYLPNECIQAGLFSPQSDLFSVGVVLYQMLFGIPPWDAFGDIVEQRTHPLAFPCIGNDVVDLDDAILNVIRKAIGTDGAERFHDAQTFLSALYAEESAETETKPPVKEAMKPSKQPPKKNAEDEARAPIPKRPVRKSGSGKTGFAAIAGMAELKAMLQTDVIDVIRHPEEYRRHGLSLPNGMLLYGPPGCGKTFFAERFAEEAEYNFIKVIASDLASIYVHGTQEKIGKVFEEARKQAPTILYFDELDAMTPDRDGQQHSYGSEVNEFLSQLDNIGDSNVFAIGSTNKPRKIDKAMLRAGRLEKHIYVPPPDFEARRTMFELYLSDRPIDFGLDYDRLAQCTENYVSADIKLIVDEASRRVIREKRKRIAMETLELVIAGQKSTLTLAVLKDYEQMRDEMNGIRKERKQAKIGF